MRQLIVFAAVLCLLPASAAGFTLATDTGDDTGNPLMWDLDETDGEVRIRHHHLGGAGHPAWLLQGSARNALRSWVEVPSADFDFSERGVFTGTACPHAIPGDDMLIQQVCGGDMPEHDGRNAFFFIETVWPFGEEVIALTTLSWSEGGTLVDADIAYNGLDYLWSALGEPAAGEVDYESITLHEVGHLLGLGHSTEPGAVMRVDYETGTMVRSLGADDAAGVGFLYPCASGSCVGAVEHPAVDKCSTAGAGRAGLAGLLVVLGAAAWRRREALRRGGLGRAAGPAALLALALVFVPADATTSTVAALQVGDLAERSERVVRARVTSVDSYRDRVVRSEITFEVLEDLRGEGADVVTIDQPGGLLDDGSGTLVFGMPRFVEGDEVVVFLGDGLLGTRVVGLAQGAFAVAGDGTLSRDLSGLMLARVGGRRAPKVVRFPATLGELRGAVAAD